MLHAFLPFVVNKFCSVVHNMHSYNTIGKVQSAENTKAPKAFFIPHPTNEISNNSYDH